MEVMLEVVWNQGVFSEVQLGPREAGGPNCTPVVIPKNVIKASMIMECTLGNVVDPEPPPHFSLALCRAFGQWIHVYLEGGLCITHVDLSNFLESHGA